jgi:N-acetylmuramoyl-L-alanine amidase
MAVAEADTTPAFSLRTSESSVGIGHEVHVVVVGENLLDLYGFEINLNYDTNRLHFKNATSNIPGLSVPAQVKGSQIRFGHTKVGATTPGDNGTIEMAELTFESIAEGKGSVAINQVKLVNSAVVVSTLKPNAQIALDVSGTKVKQPMVFTDIAGHWARESINRASTLDFIDGYPDGTFRPQAMITRAEFTVMLDRAVALLESGEQSPDFADLLDIPSWAQPAVFKAVSAGVIDGYDDHTFRAANPISRAEMTVMIMRALGEDIDLQSTTDFADADEIPTWAQASIAQAVQKGFVQGREHHEFVPYANASRAEAVTLILALYDDIANR